MIPAGCAVAEATAVAAAWAGWWLIVSFSVCADMSSNLALVRVAYIPAFLVCERHVFLMDSSALLANTAIANVEASLAFTLANKLVDGMLSMDQRPWILAVMCLVFLSLIKTAASSFLGRNAFADMGNQVLILSLSRLVLLQASFHEYLDDCMKHSSDIPKWLQIRFSAASASSPLFEYIRRFLEIAFVVVVLSAIAKLLTTSQAIQQQLGTLMVNMQRIFAETVAAIVTDPQIKMLIVLWGLCILPSISKKIGEFKTASSSASFFLV
jgi:hypothetical protein